MRDRKPCPMSDISSHTDKLDPVTKVAGFFVLWKEKVLTIPENVV